MASLRATAKVNVVHNPLNRRYVVEVRDYAREVTLGYEPLEAIAVAAKMLSVAAEYESSEVLDAVNELVDSMEVRSE